MPPRKRSYRPQKNRSSIPRTDLNSQEQELQLGNFLLAVRPIFNPGATSKVTTNVLKL